MPKYKAEVTLSHYFVQTEVILVEVEAENLESAKDIAADHARDKKSPDYFEADYTYTDTEGVEVYETDSGEDVAYRCDKTKDMFERAG